MHYLLTAQQQLVLVLALGLVPGAVQELVTEDY
jgi:hypothetical protein